MPNVIKYSTTIQPNTIKKGNVLLGINNIGYGPSNVTGYWAGINPPTSGYTIYRVATETSGYTINTCETDSDVIYWASVFGNTGGDNINQALQYLTTGNSNTTIVNKNYESIVTSGLVLNLDATFVPSYPKSGTLWYDISGNVNNGTLTNGPTYSSLSGGSIVFDGVDDYVITAADSTPALNITSQITLEAWIMSTALANASHGDGLNSKGVSSDGNSGVYEMLLIQSSSINIPFFRMRIGGSTPTYSPTNIPINLNQIYQIVSTYNGSIMRIYVNGVESGTGLAQTGNIEASTQQLTVGVRYLSRAGGADSFFSGRIYNNKIYNRALSLNEVQQNYEALGKSFVSFDIQYLVVAGGGGGGNSKGGGGGAGGLLTGYTTSLSTNTSYSVIIGAGGNVNSNGSNSKFATNTSIGGGSGGYIITTTAGTGGSGGGAGGAHSGIGTGYSGGTPTSGQGFKGGGNFDGVTVLTNSGGAGGGGASMAGVNALADSGTNGGDGLYISEYVSLGGSPSGWFAGGAGGGAPYNLNRGLGGKGGGGQGAQNGNLGGGERATTGTINTGGGGGGGAIGGAGGDSVGRAGGSGVVILRIPSAYVANFSSGVSATMTWVGSYKYYRVTATSTTSETVTFS